jgi:DUF4097 and DUF4098 domain-containing protein YvlB
MKTRKIASLMTGLAFLAMLLGLSQVATAKDRYEEKFQKTESLAKDGKVYLKNVSGDIKVVSWAEAQVKIDAVKYSDASSEKKAKEDFAKVTIEVIREGDTLRISTKYPEHKTFGHNESVDVSVDYVLSIPDQASLKIETVSGDTEIDVVGGTLNINAVSGDVDIKKVGKQAEITTVSGNLTLLEASGDVFLKAVSGDINLDSAKGSVEAETISGDIEIKEASQAKNVRIKVLSGDVNYTGAILPDGRYSLKTHSGNIEMTIPADSSFELEATTFNGNVNSEFKIEVSGNISPQELHGTVNKGGPVLKLDSFSGTIKLRKR